MTLLEAMLARDYTCIDKYSMSNLGHRITPGTAAHLKSGKYVVEYIAWNFHAWVWWHETLFAALVYTHHVARRLIYAETLVQIMEEASSEFGYE